MLFEKTTRTALDEELTKSQVFERQFIDLELEKKEFSEKYPIIQKNSFLLTVLFIFGIMTINEKFIE